MNPETGSMVTDLIPATEPAKVTRPEAGAATGVPIGTPKSRPQWPPNLPTGEYSSVTGPFTGATRHTTLRRRPDIT